jgi:AhpD family alkylhydroperoxidase
MTVRVDYRVEFPKGVAALVELEESLRESSLEPALLELVRVRASQMNGCSYCLAMHTRDARARGEDQVRLDTVAAWRETPFFSARERAALSWCESLTDLMHAGASADEYARVKAVFSPEEVAALTFAVVAINSWNRLAVGLGAEVASLEGIPASLRHASTTVGAKEVQ